MESSDRTDPSLSMVVATAVQPQTADLLRQAVAAQSGLFNPYGAGFALWRSLHVWRHRPEVGHSLSLVGVVNGHRMFAAVDDNTSSLDVWTLNLYWLGGRTAGPESVIRAFFVWVIKILTSLASRGRTDEGVRPYTNRGGRNFRLELRLDRKSGARHSA